jgi:hypothetical protein
MSLLGTILILFDFVWQPPLHDQSKKAAATFLAIAKFQDGMEKFRSMLNSSTCDFTLENVLFPCS